MQSVLFCQHTEWLHSGDGTGDSVRALQKIAQDLGFRSVIASVHEPPEGWGEDLLPAHRVHRLYSSYRTIYHVLQYAGYGYPLRRFLRAPGRRILIYHNLTPLRFFMPYRQDRLCASLILARIRSLKELELLSREVDLAVGVSRYNERELRKLGFRKTDCFPNPLRRGGTLFSDPLRSRDSDSSSPSSSLFSGKSGVSQGEESPVTIGFVGRVAPNKNLEQLLGLLFYLKRIRPGKFRLVVAGRNDLFSSYYERLLRLVEELHLEDSVRFTGFLSDEELEELYGALQYFVSMSLHEGFGIPLLEAMAHNVPVIALASGAVAETLEGSGILLESAAPAHAAELLTLLEERPEIRRAVIEGQRLRLGRIREYPFADRLLGILKRAEES